MVYILENEVLKVQVSEYGAELNSLLSKRDNIEYLWNRSPEGWKYQTPILFPIVGKVRDSKYRVNNKDYELPQHGLARLSEFSFVERSKESIKLELMHSEESLKKYPFKFKLECEYQLSNNEVQVKYRVSNVDDKKIYFSIGSHPAFMCPRDKDEAIEDYYLQFDKNEKAFISLLNEDGYLSRTKRLYLDNNNIINLKRDTFENDALIFSNLNSSKVTLKSKKNNKSLVLDFNQFPYLGIWAPKNGASLICIEPWYGYADFCDFNGEFSEKPGIIELDIDKTFECSYKIIIN